MSNGRLFRHWGLVLSLGLATVAHAQQPAALAQPVQLRPGSRSLSEVLAELSRQGRLPLSYSSSLVPLAHRYQVRPGPPRPLGVVLREVLQTEHLAYGLLDGQLVLWPDRSAPPPGVTWQNGAAAPSQPAGNPAPGSSRPAPATPAGQPIIHASAKAPVGRGRGRVAVADAIPAGRVAPPLRPPFIRQARAARPQVALATTPAPARAGQRRSLARAGATQPPAGTAGRELALLPLRPATLLAASTGPPLAALPPGVLASAEIYQGARDPVVRLSRLYVRAEAWGSESLLVGATGKVGVPRAYLLLGIGLAPVGRQTAPAFGVGVGTAGRARGRFTPNLDALAWWVGGDHDQEPQQALLLQLRPQLAWQVRRGGRLALLAGPTLNLATAHQRGLPVPRWDFAHDQWLWVNQADDQSLLRLWPGVQLGVRF